MESNTLSYLNESSRIKRLEKLNQFSDTRNYLPVDTVSDLMLLPISDQEKIELIKATESSDNLDFENFITQNVSKWNQNIASIGLWEWALRSHRILWHRTLILSHDHHLSQRLGYTLLDLAWTGGGKALIENFANKDYLEEMSEAFLSLLLFRSLQWNCNSKKLLELSNWIFEKNNHRKFQRVIPYALAYQYRFYPDHSRLIRFDQGMNDFWGNFHINFPANGKASSRIKEFKKFTTSSKIGDDTNALFAKWPSLWERFDIEEKYVSKIISLLFANKENQQNNYWEYFAGFDEKVLFAALENMGDEKQFIYAIGQFAYLLDSHRTPAIIDLIRRYLSETQDIGHFLSHIPKKYSAFLNHSETGYSPYDLAYKEQLNTISDQSSETSFILKEITEEGQKLDFETLSRKRFFLTAYSQKPKQTINHKESNYWIALSNAWEAPDTKALDELSCLARKSPYLFQLCYIKTLGKFEGIDNAALRLLDYVRSEEAEILREVVYALRGINTPRALQEMISCITRPNFNYELKIEIISLLTDADLSQLQSELRSAINDLKQDSEHAGVYWELKDALANLIKSSKDPLDTHMESDLKKDSSTTESLDQALSIRVTDYQDLSGEARRALRTAQFFHSQVSSNGQLATIDLSPAIDMQYKALELSFREKFEDTTNALIRSGVLQRKLDLIGYARPIPSSMDQFERYIENLDIIKTIPFFSRFKLRKMLRAICQYRPGRRFTLDGLKAFSLFFLCFGRKQCRYGLANIIPIPTFSDLELAEFCKKLHIFQDFRNRAAHEGFHPEASNDLEGIWENTGAIIEEMIRLEDSIKDTVAISSINKHTG